MCILRELRGSVLMWLVLHSHHKRWPRLTPLHINYPFQLRKAIYNISSLPRLAACQHRCLRPLPYICQVVRRQSLKGSRRVEWFGSGKGSSHDAWRRVSNRRLGVMGRRVAISSFNPVRRRFSHWVGLDSSYYCGDLRLRKWSQSWTRVVIP